jgi:UDP-glucuronate decarboxylase
MITGLLSLFEKPFTGSPVNLGNPQPVTMLQLANQIISIVGSTSRIRFMELPMDDPMQREPIIDKAIEQLSWRPMISRELGLEQTVSYFRSELKLRGSI